MPAEQVQNPPSLSKRLIKQWRLVGVGFAIIALAIVASSADVNLGRDTEPDRCRVEVNADVLNVRAGPGTDTETVGRLSRGDVVDAMPETTNGFRKLAADGWVSQEYVTPNAHC
jgi:uncharacterized protein YgiM (DUF1202 family)